MQGHLPWRQCIIQNSQISRLAFPLGMIIKWGGCILRAHKSTIVVKYVFLPLNIPSKEMYINGLIIHIISYFVYKVRFHILLFQIFVFQVPHKMWLHCTCAQVKQLKINTYYVDYTNVDMDLELERISSKALHWIIILFNACRNKLNFNSLFVYFLGHISCSGILLMQSVFAVVVTAVLEAKTDQVDNLVLPLVMYMLLLPLPWTAN